MPQLPRPVDTDPMRCIRLEVDTDAGLSRPATPEESVLGPGDDQQERQQWTSTS
jgi:hypothetical protein